MGRRPAFPKGRGRPKKKGNKNNVKAEEIGRVKRAYIKKKHLKTTVPTNDDEDTINNDDTEGCPVKDEMTDEEKNKKENREQEEERVGRVKRAYVKKKHVKAPVPTNDDDEDTIKNEDTVFRNVYVKLEVIDDLDFASSAALLRGGSDLVPVKSEMADNAVSVSVRARRPYTKRAAGGAKNKKGKKSEWSCQICNKHLVTKAGMAVHMQNHYVEVGYDCTFMGI